MRINLDKTISSDFIFKAICPILKRKNNTFKVDTVCTDSREAQSGDLFFALPGEKFDGENFTEEAKRKGAFTVSSRDRSSDFFVKDTVVALGSLSNAYKKLLNIKHTVAITGSVGKTTTKNLIAGILRSKYNTHATYKNFNNEIGVPLTVFSAKSNTEALVLEIGMNHEGEISRISKFVEPDISVITKIGNAHIGNLGCREKIAKAKLEILEGMKRGTLLIPYGEPLLSNIRFTKTVSVCNSCSDFSLMPLKSDIQSLKFNFYSDSTTLENAEAKLFGAHIPECLAFSLSVASLLGFTGEELTHALKALSSSEYPKIYAIGELIVFDDSYNSSPEAVAFAFESIKSFNSKKVSALLGDMLELGNKSERLHYEIGKFAADAVTDKLYLFGKYAGSIKYGAILGGIKEKNIFVNEDLDSPEQTARQIAESSKEGVLLVKASREVRLERVIQLLKDKYS